MLKVTNELITQELMVGVVVAQEVRIENSSSYLQAIIYKFLEDLCRTPENIEQKNQVRDLLRRGGYKPRGRSKPASEYLEQAARSGNFPLINNVVDINNYLSLKWGLPISTLDLDVLGSLVTLRCGRAGEKYVFNPSGQDIDLENLICVCRVDEHRGESIPYGSPVKDSMDGKIQNCTRNIICVIYNSTHIYSSSQLELHLKEYSELLKDYSPNIHSFIAESNLRS